MRIDIDDTFVITSDDRNIILNEKRGNDKEVLKPFGYYSSMKLLCKALLNLKIRRSTAESFKDLHSDIIKARVEICKLLLLHEL